MPESFDDNIRAAILRGSPEDKAYLRNAGRKGAKKAAETRLYNAILAELEKENLLLSQEQDVADMEALAKERGDDLLDD